MRHRYVSLTLFFALVSFVSATSASAQGMWTAATPMPGSRSGHSAVVLGGQVHVVGGLSPTDGCLNTHIVYDPATATWTPRAPMPTSRQHAGAAVLNGLLYVVGGDSGCSSQTGILEAYDPATDRWTTRTSMPTPRGTFAAAAFEGKLYAVGGILGGMIDVVEAYDPVGDTWTTKAPLPTVAWGMAIGAIDDGLYVAGGTSNTDFLGVYRYSSATNTWTDRSAPMAVPRIFAASAVHDGQLHVVGGLIFDSSLSSAVERYDATTNSWSAVASLPDGRDEFAAVSLNGGLYAIGGNGPGIGDNVEVFTGGSQTPAQIVSQLLATTTIDGFQNGANLLRSVLRSTAAGNTNAACGQLTAFINMVQAQAGGSLTAAQAQSFIAEATNARTAVGCQ